MMWVRFALNASSGASVGASGTPLLCESATSSANTSRLIPFGFLIDGCFARGAGPEEALREMPRMSLMSPIVHAITRAAQRAILRA